jgi:SAM-dependent methyltransferase
MAVQWLREQPEQQELVMAAYYDDPLLSAADRYWCSEEWNAIRSILPAASGRALDVGAGRGIASYALAKEGYAVTALEPDSSSIVGAQAIRNLAVAGNLSIEVKEEFSEKLPFPDSQFDVVFARAVLHHTRDLAEACREFFRVLKPGGCFLAIREHVISKPEDLDAFLEVHPLHKLYGGENAFLLEQYESAICGAGFRLDRILAPLESEINFAPYTGASLREEIAARLSLRIPGLKQLVNGLMGLPLCWTIVSRILGKLDNRPGRLYSFVATRP